MENRNCGDPHPPWIVKPQKKRVIEGLWLLVRIIHHESFTTRSHQQTDSACVNTIYFRKKFQRKLPVPEETYDINTHFHRISREYLQKAFDLSKYNPNLIILLTYLLCIGDFICNKEQ